MMLLRQAGSWTGPTMYGFKLLVIACLSGCVMTGAKSSSESERTGTPDRLRNRVAPPHGDTLAAYVRSGAVDAKAHRMTERDWALVDRSLAALPLQYRRVLDQRLARLSFVDAPASAGTALTREFEDGNGGKRFDITLRADALEMSLEDFMMRKEERLFIDDGSGYALRVSVGKMPALTYLLLHESVHVLDGSYGISTETRPFAALWPAYRELTPLYSAGVLGKSLYRGGSRLTRSDMPKLVRALHASPFVSLYATASAGEDLAELGAWDVLSRRFHVPLTISVVDAAGRTVVSVKPLESQLVQARLAAFRSQLASAPRTLRSTK